MVVGWEVMWRWELLVWVLLEMLVLIRVGIVGMMDSMGVEVEAADRRQ